MNAPKVPSLISYSKTSATRRHRQWGYSIDENSHVIRWTKLELESRSKEKELDILRDLVDGLDLVSQLHTNKDTSLRNKVPEHITKDAEDVVQDFLGKVSREWYLYMKRQGKYTLESVPLDMVISHPAVGTPIPQGWPF